MSKMSFFIFYPLLSDCDNLVSFTGIHQTRCQSWRAPWSTTRRSWRTWDSSGDRYPQDVFGLIFPHVASGAASQTSSFLSISQRKLLFLFQNKLMEEKNTVLVQTNVGLEEELRKANAAKGQLETYKRQVPDRRPCWPSPTPCVFLSSVFCPHRWLNFRTGCLKSLKRPTRWSLSTNVSKRKSTPSRKKRTYVELSSLQEHLCVLRSVVHGVR